MRCPFCAHDDSQVKDSRPTEDNTAIRRRRQCESCGARFTTFERVQLRELTILKKNGQRAPFDRDKLYRSIQVATRKRPVDPERVDRIVNSIQRRLESSGESEIKSGSIGEMVAEAMGRALMAADPNIALGGGSRQKKWVRPLVLPAAAPVSRTRHPPTISGTRRGCSRR